MKKILVLPVDLEKQWSEATNEANRRNELLAVLLSPDTAALSAEEITLNINNKWQASAAYEAAYRDVCAFAAGQSEQALLSVYRTQGGRAVIAIYDDEVVPTSDASSGEGEHGHEAL